MDLTEIEAELGQLMRRRIGYWAEIKPLFRNHQARAHFVRPDPKEFPTMRSLCGAIDIDKHKLVDADRNAPRCEHCIQKLSHGR